MTVLSINVTKFYSIHATHKNYLIKIMQTNFIKYATKCIIYLVLRMMCYFYWKTRYTNYMIK